tara:strand:+ start:3898 stop:4512 length:615 start_codon:yes stop_codon:yes gene_type:complete
MYKFPVIIFEGIEASGKSTNLRLVSNFLKKYKRKFIKIREPGGSKFSESLRNLMLSKNSILNYKTDLLLILAARSENMDKILRKNLGRKIILIDRFTDSTIAYQHYGMGIDIKLIKDLNGFVLRKFKPTITFLNIVNKKNMIKRMKKRAFTNKYDKFNYKFYNKVQKGFIKIAKNKKNYLIIDSNKKSIKDNSETIINKIKKII